MVEPSYKVSFAGSPGLEKLHQLIAKRQTHLKECARDAIVATGITAIQAIRAATRRHKGKGVKVNG